MPVRLIGIGAVAAIVGLTAGCKPDTPAQAGSGTYIVVSPADLHGWELVTNETDEFPYNRAGNRASTARYRFRTGPGRPPAGTGSLLLATGNKPNSRVAAIAPAVAGSRLGSMAEISYSTYVTRARSRGMPLPINFKIAIVPMKGPRFSTLVFEPSAQSGQVPQTRRWQTWDPLAGDWWATGMSVRARCSQNRKCSWGTLEKRMGSRSIITGAYFELGDSGSEYVGAACALDKVVINGTAYDLEKRRPSKPPKVPVTG